MKNVLLFDLDNTIYPVSSIAPKLFKTLFAHIKLSGEFEGDVEAVVNEIQRIPFQKVAETFSFSPKLLTECINMLCQLTFNEPMYFFKDYAAVRLLPQKKYLITSGFTKMQQSKIQKLGIGNDFEEIHIIDLELSKLTKKEVFRKILHENNYRKDEVLVVGDDLHSEIQAGKELNIDTVLYNRVGRYSNLRSKNVITNFKELNQFL